MKSTYTFLKKHVNKINALAGKLNFGAGGISPFGRGRPMSIAAPRSTPPGGLGGLACQPAHTRTRSRSTASEPMVNYSKIYDTKWIRSGVVHCRSRLPVVRVPPW